MKKILLALLLTSSFALAQNANHKENVQTKMEHREGNFQKFKNKKLPANCASEEDLKDGKCKMPENFKGKHDKAKEFKGEKRKEGKHKTWNKGKAKKASPCDEKAFKAGKCVVI